MGNHLADFYKTSHASMYPKGLTELYNNTTPRGSRLDHVDEVVVFGIQYLVKQYFISEWNEQFFNKTEDHAINRYVRLIKNTTGGEVDEDNLRALHRLGYLPIRVKSLPEGALCPIQVPLMTIKNTDPRFAWLANYLETLVQTVTWLPITTATIAYHFRKMLNDFAEKTTGSNEFCAWQGHDFSMRGMSSVESCKVGGAGHLLSFTGTDTIPAIDFLEQYYNANIETELVGGSVPASEHSVMQVGMTSLGDITTEDGRKQAEILLTDHLLDLFPQGILSQVSDTYDYWRFLNEILPRFVDKIRARDGKFVVRPDSGDPVRVITGYKVQETDLTADEVYGMIKHQTGYMRLFTDGVECVHTCDGKFITPQGEISRLEAEGSMEILWRHFGGTTNLFGYRELDPHIGLIYGDSITYDRAKKICQRLMDMGFASTNVVFGVGSFTYQYNTRDTFGLACKATSCVVDGKRHAVFKDPKTGGMKKSARGLLQVYETELGGLALLQDVTEEQEEQGELVTVFEDGKLVREYTLAEIRKRLWV
jgi:nicotinamide phosphoribosyltransferase